MEYTAPTDNAEIGKEQIVATCRSGVFLFSFFFCGPCSNARKSLFRASEQHIFITLAVVVVEFVAD